MDIQKLDQTYIAGTYARFPVTIVKGKGSLVWDENGKEYIDLSTGIAVDIFGVADEQWRPSRSSSGRCSISRTFTTPSPVRSSHSCCARRPG